MGRVFETQSWVDLHLLQHDVRRNGLTMLSKEDLDLIFMSYNVGKVLSYEKFEKGSGQLNFKVNTLTDSFVLKYFIKEIKKDNIVFDGNFNYFIEKNSFKCPRIIKNKHDNCIGELNGKPYILYEFIEYNVLQLLK